MEPSKNLTHKKVLDILECVEKTCVECDTDASPWFELWKDKYSWMCPGSIDKHHAYEGGLIRHTYEVLRGAVAMADVHGANVGVVAEAALWHDAGKLECYGRGADGEWVKTHKYHALGHVSISHARYVEAVGRDWEVEHAILAHHGRREWRSPVEPQTLEAWIVHWADMASARPWERK